MFTSDDLKDGPSSLSTISLFTSSEHHFSHEIVFLQNIELSSLTEGFWQQVRNPLNSSFPSECRKYGLWKVLSSETRQRSLRPLVFSTCQTGCFPTELYQRNVFQSLPFEHQTHFHGEERMIILHLQCFTAGCWFVDMIEKKSEKEWGTSSNPVSCFIFQCRSSLHSP